MTVPSLSIVVPCHSCADLLRSCLISIVRHAPRGTEVLILDDASPGDSVRTTAAGFPDVRVLRLPKRRGFAGAANAGIAAARAPIAELLNDDAEATNGWADAALARFADPHVVAVAPLVLRHGDCGESRSPIIDSAGDDYDLGGYAQKRGHGQQLNRDHAISSEVFGASASSAFYRTAAVRRVGSFPASFSAYFEDVDLSFRLRRIGSIVFEPASVVWHRGGQSYGRRSRSLVERQSCNEERVFWRNIPPGALARSLPRHLAVLVGKAWRRCNEGALVPWACGRLRAWKEVPAARRHARSLDGLGPLRPWPSSDFRHGELAVTGNLH